MFALGHLRKTSESGLESLPQSTIARAVREKYGAGSAPEQHLSFKEAGGHPSALLCMRPALTTNLHQKKMWTQNSIPPNLH